MATDDAIKVHEFIDENGRSPYKVWLESLGDKRAQAKIILQIDRMELGNFGDSQPIGNGLSELRIHHGPGYRIYYAREGKNIYLILCGGDKSSQKKDIKLAKNIWAEHKKADKSK